MKRGLKGAALMALAATLSVAAQTPADSAAILQSAKALVADSTAIVEAVKAPAHSKALRKSPTGAMLRSMAVPGLGQWYNQKRFKAVIVAGVEIGLIVDAVVQNQLAAQATISYDREFYRNNRSLAIWWLGAAILYSMADAYVDAHLFDFDERPELTLAPVLLPGSPGADPVMAFSLALHF